jgi:hypothetical protein
MAALPLIRAGIKIVGRERVKNFLATALATLIQGYVGPVAAKALAPHIAHTGLRLLSLEAGSSELLGAEALVDTLEETITPGLVLHGSRVGSCSSFGGRTLPSVRAANPGYRAARLQPEK